MRLKKRFATIGVAAAAAVLFSSGGAQAQGDGGLLSLLGARSLLDACSPLEQVGLGESCTAARENNNNNNNNNGGVNNNNNNNGTGEVNNNNNNNVGTTPGQGGGLLSILGTTSIIQVCYPMGQVGQGNTFTGTQNINCNQNAGS
ncbi:hypothetical protein ABZ719_24510 [Streptomyces sp. NPDC006743]|uniref:hypothetical protein n=1 Tax=Streptomyces sp. NPDC006743 TaxID=3154480 RepID=UPI00345213A0